MIISSVASRSSKKIGTTPSDTHTRDVCELGRSICALRVASRTAADRSYMSPMSTVIRSEEHTSELQSQSNLVCRLLLEKKKKKKKIKTKDKKKQKKPKKIISKSKL